MRRLFYTYFPEASPNALLTVHIRVKSTHKRAQYIFTLVVNLNLAIFRNTKVKCYCNFSFRRTAVHRSMYCKIKNKFQIYYIHDNF